MMSLEEQIILEKLMGKCPIHYVEDTMRPVQQVAEENQSSARDTAGCGIDMQQVEGHFMELDRCLRKMDSNRENYAFRHIYSCRAIIGQFIVFGKRVVRKCLKWYIEPICNQQTEFNNAITPAIGRLCQLQRTTLDELQRQLYTQSEMQEQLTQMQGGQNGMQEQLTQMQGGQNGMQEQLTQMQGSQGDLSRQVASLQEEKQQLRLQLQQLQQQLETERNAQNTVKLQLEGQQQGLQQQMNDMLQQLCEAREQIQELREQGAFAEVVANEQVMKKSTSQSGEDMISEYIARVLGKRLEDVTYLDLGANHAKLYSNTYHFYQKGVRGVLVEANPALIGELKFYRSGDVILNRCISSTSGETVDFYVLNGDGLSTPDLAGAKAAIAENPYLKIEQVVPVKTITVEEILDTYFDRTPTIVNLDIEGEEMSILNSIGFTKHRPLIMIIETIPYRKHLVVGLKNQEIVDFMAEKNYIEYAFTGINSIFIDKEQIAEVLE